MKLTKRAKAVLAAVLDDAELAKDIKLQLLIAYTMIWEQPAYIKQRVAEHYANVIIANLRQRCINEEPEVCACIKEFFVQSIVKRTITIEFYKTYFNTLRHSPRAVMFDIRTFTWIYLQDYKIIFANEPHVQHDAQKKLDHNITSLNYWITHHQKFFTRQDALAHRKQIYHYIIYKLLPIFVIVFSILQWAELSMTTALGAAFLCALVPAIKSNSEFYSERTRNLSTNIRLTIENCMVEDEQLHTVPMLVTSQNPSAAVLLQSSSQTITATLQNNQDMLLGIQATKPENQLSEPSSSAPESQIKIRAKKQAREPEPAQHERDTVPQQQPAPLPLPAEFDPRYQNLKAKYLVKVEGKGAGLGAKATLFAIWDKPQIKSQLKPKDKPSYKQLKRIFLDLSAAAPCSDHGLKLLKNLGLFEVKGSGVARAFGDTTISVNGKTAMIIDSFSRYGAH
jgi:hypothetical protein